MNLQAYDSALEANLRDLMRKRDKVVISLVGILDQRVVEDASLSELPGCNRSKVRKMHSIVTWFESNGLPSQRENVAFGTLEARSKMLAQKLKILCRGLWAKWKHARVGS